MNLFNIEVFNYITGFADILRHQKTAPRHAGAGRQN